jgi:hypothetical protein
VRPHRLLQIANVACTVLLCCASTAFAQPWQLTTSDFQTQQVELAAINSSGVSVTPTNGQPATVPFERFLQLEREGAQGTQGGPFVLHLIGGDRISGGPVALDGESLRWTSSALGELVVPLQQAAVMQRQGRAVQVDETRPQDVIALTNGDAVAGIVSDINADSITIQSEGQPVVVPLDTLASAAFATTAAAAPSRETGFRVTLVDDTSITVVQLEKKDNTLHLQIAGSEARTVPLEQVRRIEQLNGPVVWLSSLPPNESDHIPYFTQRAIPARFDENVDGQPVRFGSRTFARGIGVHARSRLSWKLDPHFTAFRTQYAIAGDLPYADVTVRVKVDDRVVHEQKNVKAGVLSPVVTADLKGGSTLTLEVDYGEGYDVQDRFNWIEPALLRNQTGP